MTLPLFTPNEIAAIQGLAKPGFQTLFRILRPAIVNVDSQSPAYKPEEDFGDDELENLDVDANVTPVCEVRGWLFAWPLVQNVSDGAGQIGTIDTHELRLPVGTDILAMDIAIRDDNGQAFIVVSTSDDDSWPDMLRCILRRRE